MEKLTYEDAKNYLLNRHGSRGIHTLEKIGLILDKLGNPQDKIKVIHIAGTNGKGSTTKMLAEVFSKSNKVGAFTSPYIRRINEAISINGNDISDDDFANIISRLKEPIEDLEARGYYLTYFEVLTTMMYLYFYEQKVDLAIVETGLGGLMDATNIIKKPMATVITTISLDHTNILGDSIEEIAYQKAGIIKNGCPVFLYPQSSSAYKVIKNMADQMSSQIFTYRKDDVSILVSDDRQNIFSFGEYENVSLSLLGTHQIYNACLALMVIDYFKDDFGLSQIDIIEGMMRAENPGRLTTICNNPRVMVDGSHNKEAIDAMKKSIDKFSYDRLIIGFAVLEDKDYSYIIDVLADLADELIVTSMKNSRALTFDKISQISKEKFTNPIAIEDTKKAYQYSKKIARRDDLVIWCGSLYLVAYLINIEEKNKLDANK